MEADLQCSIAIQNMEKQLRTACHAPNAKLVQVLKVRELLPQFPFQWLDYAKFSRCHSFCCYPMVSLLKFGQKNHLSEFMRCWNFV